VSLNGRHPMYQYGVCSRCLHFLHSAFLVFSLSNIRINIYLVLSAKIFGNFKQHEQTHDHALWSCAHVMIEHALWSCAHALSSHAFNYFYIKCTKFELNDEKHNVIFVIVTYNCTPISILGRVRAIRFRILHIVKN